MVSGVLFRILEPLGLPLPVSQQAAISLVRAVQLNETSGSCKRHLCLLRVGLQSYSAPHPEGCVSKWSPCMQMLSCPLGHT